MVDNRGMSLVELVITLAIVAILAAMGTIWYQHFILKAQSVEGHSALAEINRLEALYLLHHDRYTDDLTLLGFSGGPTLRHHRIEVQLQNNGARFVASAIPLGI